MKVTVKSLGVSKDYEIDSDPLKEACIRYVKDLMGEEGTQKPMSVILECCDPTQSKSPVCYNSYHILLAAGYPKEAELIRTQFLERFEIDLQKEALRST